MESVIAIENLNFRWPGSQRDVLALKALSITKGEKVFLKGASGSGKTSLLSLIGGISAPSGGKIRLLDQPVSSLKQSRKDRIRADHIGFIFQQFNLLPYLSVIDNVTLSCKFSKLRKQKVLAKGISLEEEAERLLSHLQFPTELLARPVSDLSVGQQQRVAVARALIGSPEIIIADEPTSALDAQSRGHFIHLLISECEAAKASVLFVSHDPSLESYFDRTIELEEINQATAHSQELAK